MARRLTPEEREEQAINKTIKRRMRANAKAERDERDRINRARIDQNKYDRLVVKNKKEHDKRLRVIKTNNDRLAQRKGAYKTVLGQYETAMEDGINYQIQGRFNATHLFEIKPFRFIGWKSEAFLAAVDAPREPGVPKIAPTHEHIYPRQFDGEFLLCHCLTMGGMSYQTFLDYVMVFTQTAHVLPHENKTLEKYQDRHSFVTPEQAYTEAGVKVVTFESKERFYRLEEVAPRKVLHAYFGRRSHA